MQNTFRGPRLKKIRDLSRSEHYIQGAREQGPPGDLIVFVDAHGQHTQ